jgi:hypothetical protein
MLWDKIHLAESSGELMNILHLSPSFAQTGYGTFSYIALSSCAMNDSKVRKITTAALSILEL